MAIDTLPDEVRHHIPRVHPTPEETECYRSAAHSVGLDETLDLILRERPASALRRLARTVEEELACEGLAGFKVPVSDAMARVAAAGHYRRTVSRRLRHHGEADR